MGRLSLRRVMVISSAIGIGWVIIAPAASATTSQLRQQVLPTDCIVTTVATGSSQQVVGECPAESPTVTSVETSIAGERMIRGLFDATRTTVLKVVFRGVTYTAGTPGSPLSIAGDSWTFSLDDAQSGIPPGAYLLDVIALLVDGRTLSTTADFEIPAEENVVPDHGFTPGAPSTGAWFESIISPIGGPSLAPIDTIQATVYRPLFNIDDRVGKTLSALTLTEYGKAVVVLSVTVVVILARYAIRQLRRRE